ncbi:hypothetical protein NW767_000001 [Fusarium falciforme]|nr:hypothetical protein NW767_000001 [Fusarium falciforme]
MYAKEDLTLARDGARAKAEKLEKDLAKALKEADELRKMIEELRYDIYKDKIQDEEARKILEDTQEKLMASQAEVSDLKQKLSKAQGEIEDLKARIGKLLDKVVEQQTIISRLETELDVQIKKNVELTKENGLLKSANSELEDSKSKTQGRLDRANKRIAALEQTIKE